MIERLSWVLDLDQAGAHLEPFYSHTGRPSIDPELTIRMLLIGYCYPIRSGRRESVTHRKASCIPILYHPDFNRRLRIHTES